jgi:hypothetical protein
MASNSAFTLAAFVIEKANANPEIRVHSAACSYVIRETRANGKAVLATAESEVGMIKRIKSNGIRYSAIRFMGCCGVPEGFWIESPSGDQLKLSTTRVGARTATARIKREARAELDTMLSGLSGYAREVLREHSSHVPSVSLKD